MVKILSRKEEVIALQENSRKFDFYLHVHIAMAMNTVALKKLISERKCNIGQLLKQEKDLLAMLEVNY